MGTTRKADIVSKMSRRLARLVAEAADARYRTAYAKSADDLARAAYDLSETAIKIEQIAARALRLAGRLQDS